MAYPQGAVVFATDPFGGNSGGRPYVVLSNESHPFTHNECVAAVVTTTERAAAIELDEQAFERGSLPKRSFVSPWSVVTLKKYAISKHVATVTDPVVDATVAELTRYLETE
ncbi:type II toxin-antitoxin system PemK/MazF family toxin [Natrinema soli]|uniref:Type II toxin-antitoxin system PemK/MazF family toxin n=1 Tax=Natrinema soli TaxID=1930624 RepID=A0ABD5SIZ0_9EURY|nr:type II toxin-antitoxin system PemK/MazF family toxin [Natrinema soli]